MGAIGSVLNTAQLLTSVGSYAARVSASQEGERAQAQALSQLKAQQDLQMAQARANADLERAQIMAQGNASENERQRALKRAVSRQRASFGAQGVGSSGGGSSQAVLLGLFEESEDEKRKREEMDSLKFSAIDQNLADQQAINVLQRTQLQQRNTLDDISNYSSLGNSLVSFMK